MTKWRLNTESKLQSLDQLLKLMYCHSRNIQNLKVAAHHTRGAEKVVFKVLTKCSIEYLNIPCDLLCDLGAI